MTYDLRPVEATCPVCGRTDAELLWTLSAEQVANIQVLVDRDPERCATMQEHITSIWQQPTCDMVRCKHCEFEFASPFVSGDSRYYELMYHDEVYVKSRWEWDLTTQRIRTLAADRSAEDRALLEIGAGNGAFLTDLVPSAIEPEHVVCTEYSPNAMKRLRDRGFDCRDEDFRTLDGAAYAHRFSFVCMFHVLEHLDQLDRVFEAFNHLTKQEARLFISLPNPMSSAFFEAHDVWPEYPPHHTGRWRRRTFEFMGERFGWEVVDHRLEPASILQVLKHFASRSMLERSRRRGSIQYRVRLIGNKRLRRLALTPFLAFEAMRALPSLPRIWKGDLGRAQWVEMRRI